MDGPVVSNSVVSHIQHVCWECVSDLREGVSPDVPVPVYHPGRGPGEEGGRVNFLITQLGKKRTKGRELFRKHGPDCFDSYVRGTHPGAAGDQDGMRGMLVNDCSNRILNDVLVVRDHIVKDHFVLLPGLLFHPVSTLVINKAAAARNRYDGKFEGLWGVCFVGFCAHGKSTNQITLQNQWVEDAPLKGPY